MPTTIKESILLPKLVLVANNPDKKVEFFNFFPLEEFRSDLSAFLDPLERG